MSRRVCSGADKSFSDLHYGCGCSRRRYVMGEGETNSSCELPLIPLSIFCSTSIVAGEYTTGYVHGAASKSDKKIGVVGLVLFDLRRRGLVNKISICDRTGLRFAAIRDHFQEKISKVC